MVNSEKIRLYESLYGNLPDDSITAKIYKLRKTNGLSLSDFAAKVGISVSAVQDWEAMGTPSQASIEKICSAFGLDVSEFIKN